jgi:prophage regulatory protein
MKPPGTRPTRRKTTISATWFVTKGCPSSGVMKTLATLERPGTLIRILRKPVVCERIGLSPSTIQRMIEAGTFPKGAPIALGRAVGWLEADVNAWIVAHFEENDQDRS